LKEASESLTISLPQGSNIRYNIQDGGEFDSLSQKIPSPFKREYEFVKPPSLPAVFYFGGPRGLTKDSLTVDSREGGVGAPSVKKEEAGLYVTPVLEDAKEYASKNKDGVVYAVTLKPNSQTFSYGGKMKPQRSFIVNFSADDYKIFRDEHKMDALYDPQESKYLVILNKDIIDKFDAKPVEEFGD